MANRGKRCIVDRCNVAAAGVIVVDEATVRYVHTVVEPPALWRMPVCEQHGVTIERAEGAGWSLVQDDLRLDVVRIVRVRG